MGVYVNGQERYQYSGRSGVVGIEYLRELSLLVGGIVVLTMLLLWLTQSNPKQKEMCTAAHWAEASGESQPSLPIYDACALADQRTVWLRRGQFSLVGISMSDGGVLEQISVPDGNVCSSAHSLDGRVHAYATISAMSLTVIRDGEECVREDYSDSALRSIAVAITADGSRIAASSEIDRVVLFSTETSPPGRVEIAVSSVPAKLRWSPGGDRLLVASHDGFLKMLSASGEILWGPCDLAQRITAVAWDPNGVRVAVGFDGGDLAILDATDGGLQWRERLDSLSVTAVSFSVDGKRLAVAGFDRAVHVISAENGRRLMRMRGHYDTITALQFLTDGDRVLSSSLDGTVRIWSSCAGLELQNLLTSGIAR